LGGIESSLEGTESREQGTEKDEIVRTYEKSVCYYSTMRKLMIILISGSMCLAQQQTQTTQSVKQPLFAPPPLQHPCTPNPNLTPAPVVAGPNMSAYAAARQNAIAPAYEYSKCHDFEGALQIYLNVLKTYPDDARVLYSAGQTAMFAGDLDIAIPLFQKEIAQHGRGSQSSRLCLMAIYIKLNRWDDFNALRLDTRKVTIEGHDPSLNAERGFGVETLGTGKEFLSSVEFPVLHGEFKTRDRFVLYEEKDPCTGFTPHIDFESPDGKNYSLVAYPSADTRNVIKVYADGEPSYQTVRADVLAVLPTPLTKHFEHNAPCVAKPSLVPSAASTTAPQ